jgi:hypothetical protein
MADSGSWNDGVELSKRLKNAAEKSYGSSIGGEPLVEALRRLSSAAGLYPFPVILSQHHANYTIGRLILDLSDAEQARRLNHRVVDDWRLQMAPSSLRAPGMDLGIQAQALADEFDSHLRAVPGFGGVERFCHHLEAEVSPEMVRRLKIKVSTNKDLTLDDVDAFKLSEFVVALEEIDSHAANPAFDGLMKSPGLPAVPCVTISCGQKDLSLQVDDGPVMALTGDNKLLFSFFMTRIHSGSPNELVPFGDLNKAIGADGPAMSSSSLRNLIYRFNKSMNETYGEPPTGRWIESQKGSGCCLNRSVKWALSKKLEDLLSSRSVFGHSTDPNIIAETYADGDAHRRPSASGRRRGRGTYDGNDD